jgi:hypothetical protein
MRKNSKKSLKCHRDEATTPSEARIVRGAAEPLRGSCEARRVGRAHIVRNTTSEQSPDDVWAPPTSSNKNLVFIYKHSCTIKYLRNNFVPHPYTTQYTTIRVLDGTNTSITVDQFLQNYLVPAFKTVVANPFDFNVIFMCDCALNYQPDMVFKGDVNTICEEWIKKKNKIHFFHNNIYLLREISCLLIVSN